ncbi:G protein-coupled glucose receptor regulating Gpa2-domain-containing protein [Myxozyma melibiosi]|uniref:G protein-coupled glucose receptor regulating Gpa2-domain-containing protein n=1 Tax=Myxozyma melibiosi TaxID=54550 RepID=A0ABR1F3H7_9ASCO
MDILPRDGLYDYSRNARHGIRIISFVSSWLSIISCFLAFFWLYRLPEKVFRHLLIFLLLFFDCWRAIILMWYPIRLWYTGEDSIGPHACQADGFFAALSIEAGDFAVLAIAIHTYMFVMYPQVSSSGAANKYGGLYKYRKPLFVAWAIFSVLFASLPFVKSKDAGSAGDSDLQEASLGYIQLTTWCYLPISPIWYRLVLAWVPRYIVLFTICAIYFGVYRYVRRVLRKVEVIQHDVQDVPLTIPADPTLSSPPLQTNLQDIEKHPRSPILPTNENPSTIDNSTEEIIGYDLSFSPGDAAYFDQNVRFPNSPPAQSTITQTSPATSPQFEDRKIEVDISSQDRQRANVLRQVKYLLLYPVFYVIMWAPPFIEQCLMYTSYYQNHPVAWLGYISAFMYGISGFFNAFIFAIRETPWSTKPTLQRSSTLVEDSYGPSDSPSSFAADDSQDNSSSSAEKLTASPESSDTNRSHSILRFGRKQSVSADTQSADSPAPPKRTFTGSSLREQIAGSTWRRPTISKSPAAIPSFTGLDLDGFDASGTATGSVVTPYDIMKVQPVQKKQARQTGDWLDEMIDEL